MPFYNVTSHAMLVEADTPTEAAMLAYRSLEDRTPHQFDVAGPDAEISHVILDENRQEEALTIEFGKRRGRRVTTWRLP